MRVLVIYAHPRTDSFQSSLHACVVNTLRRGGHEVDDCDLYAENFWPVLGAEERGTYHDVHQNRGAASTYIERLLNCEGLVFVFPCWWYGMPAILKGFFDRVWVPGVAFEVVEGATKPLLQHVVRLAVVTTYGSPWWLNILVFGDPNRRVLMRCIRHLISPNARTLWLAQYGMDYIDENARHKFLQKVSRSFQTF